MGWKIPRKSFLLDTTRVCLCAYELTETMAAWSMRIWTHRDHGSMHRDCTGPRQMGSSWEKWTHAPTPNPEAVYKCQPFTKEKLLFPIESHLYTIHPMPSKDGQHKTNAMIFLEILFLSPKAWGFFFNLTGILLIYYGFRFCIFKGFVLCVCVYMCMYFLYFFCFVLFFFACFSKERDRRYGVRWGREDLGGDEGGEAMIKINCIKIYFQIKSIVSNSRLVFDL